LGVEGFPKSAGAECPITTAQPRPFLLDFGSLVFRIFRKVGIVSDCFLNPLNETRPLDPNAMGQLILSGQMTSCRRGCSWICMRLLRPLQKWSGQCAVTRR
jgi:hypothetical protein